MSKTKKILSIVLAVVMAFGVFSICAFADCTIAPPSNCAVGNCTNS